MTESGTSWQLKIEVDDSDVTKKLEAIETELNNIKSLDFSKFNKPFASFSKSLSDSLSSIDAAKTSLAELSNAITAYNELTVNAKSFVVSKLNIAPQSAVEVAAEISPKAAAALKAAARNLAVIAGKELAAINRTPINAKLVLDQNSLTAVKTALAGIGKVTGVKVSVVDSKDAEAAIKQTLATLSRHIYKFNNTSSAQTSKAYSDALFKGVADAFKAIGAQNLGAYVGQALKQGIDVTAIQKGIEGAIDAGFLTSDFKVLYDKTYDSVKTSTTSAVEEGTAEADVKPIGKKVKKSVRKGTQEGLEEGLGISKYAKAEKEMSAAMTNGVKLAQVNIIRTIEEAINNPAISAALKNTFGERLKTEVTAAIANSAGPDKLKDELYSVVQKFKSELLSVGISPKLAGDFAKSLKTSVRSSLAGSVDVGGVVGSSAQAFVAPLEFTYPNKTKIEAVLSKISAVLPVDIKIASEDKAYVENLLKEMIANGLDPKQLEPVLKTIGDLIVDKNKLLSPGGSTFADILIQKLGIINQQLAAIASVAKTSNTATVDVQLDDSSITDLTKDVEKVKAKVKTPVEVLIETDEADLAIDTLDDSVEGLQKRLDQLVFDLRSIKGAVDRNVIEEYAARWRELRSELGGASLGFNGLIRTAKGLDNVMGKEFLNATKVSLKSLSDAARNDSSSFRLMGNSFKSARDVLKSFITTGNVLKGAKFGVSIASMAANATGAGMAINGLIDVILALNRAANGTTKIPLATWAQVNGGSYWQRGAYNVNAFANSLKVVKIAFDLLGKGSTGMVKNMEKLGGIFSQFSMSGMGLMFMGQAVSMQVAQIMGSAGQVEGTLTKTATILGNTKDEIVSYYDEISKSVQKIASTAPIAKSEVANVQKEVAALGRTGDQLEKFSSMSIMGATAMGGDDAVSVAKMLDSAINTYGGDMEKAAYYSDLFTVVTNSTSLAIGDFASIFNQALGTAATFKLPIEDLMEFITVAKKAGVASETIGSSVKSTLLHIAKGDNAQLSDFIRNNNIAIPAGIKEMDRLTQAYNDSAANLDNLTQRKLALEKTGQTKGSEYKGISSQWTAAKKQVEAYGQEIDANRGTATKFFNEIVAGAYAAEKEGKITQDQLASMFETTDVTAMLSYGKYVDEQKQDIANIKADIANAKGITKMKYEGAMTLPENKMQALKNQISGLNDTLYKSFRDQQIKLYSLVVKYMPQIEMIFNSVVKEIDKLGDAAVRIIGPFLDWFAGLDEGIKSFIVSKALLVALAGVIGGPLMVYVGGIGSAFNGIAKAILMAGDSIGGFIKNSVDMYSALMLGGQGSLLPTTSLMDKLRTAVDLTKQAMSKGGKSEFLKDFITTATSSNIPELLNNIRTMNEKMLAGTANKILSMKDAITGYGSSMTGFGTKALGALRGLGSGGSILGGLKTAIFGVAAALPLMATGLLAVTIAAAPYIAAAIAIIGVIYLLFNAIGGTEGAVGGMKVAFQAMMDFLSGAYDFIMTIITPIIQVIDTIGQYFVKIFDAVKEGDWGEVSKLVEGLSNELTDIIKTALMSIGGMIYETLSGFFAQTGDFVDGGGLGDIAMNILAFLATLTITVITTIGTLLGRVFTWLELTAWKLLVKFFIALGSFMFDLFVDTIAWVVNGVLIGVPEMLAGLFKGIIDLLPVPDELKAEVAKRFTISKLANTKLKGEVTAIAKGIKSGKNKLQKELETWFDSTAPIDDRSKEAKDASEKEMLAKKEGLKKGAAGMAGTVQKDITSLLGGAETNPLAPAEASSAVIASNLQTAQTSLTGMATRTIPSAPSVASPYTPSFMKKPSMVTDNLSYVSKMPEMVNGFAYIGKTGAPGSPSFMGAQPTVDQYSTGAPAMGGNSYTVNIGTINVGTVEEAQQIVNNPAGLTDTPVINTGVNVGI